MTPEAMSRTHAACFQMPRPWSAAEFASFLADPRVLAVGDAQAFVLARIVGPEAEILTVAVAPERRRQGLGKSLMQSLHARAADVGAEVCYLEVAEGNLPARSLYAGLGYAEAGRRKNYYQVPGAPSVTALVLRRDLGPSTPAAPVAPI